jgi:uridine phosphorylase
VCSSIGRPARMPSITTGMKEEQQIRVRIEFGVERGRTRVEGERIRVREVLVCFDWIGCPQSAVAPCIYSVGRSCPSRTHQIYL